MTHANLVAREMTQAGFKTLVTQSNDSAVAVSLTSRKVNQIEVKTALEQIFDSIQFDCQSRPYGILVTW